MKKKKKKGKHMPTYLPTYLPGAAVCVCAVAPENEAAVPVRA